MPIRMRCLRPLAASSGAVGPRPDPPGRIPQAASRRDLRWLALDGRTDGDVADLDVVRLLDGKGDGAGDGVGRVACGGLTDDPAWTAGLWSRACLEALEVQKVTPA